jgi:hypothetical protein
MAKTLAELNADLEANLLRVLRLVAEATGFSARRPMPPQIQALLAAEIDLAFRRWRDKGRSGLLDDADQPALTGLFRDRMMIVVEIVGLTGEEPIA